MFPRSELRPVGVALELGPPCRIDRWLGLVGHDHRDVGQHQAQANSTQRNGPSTKTIAMKHAVRNAMVIVYRRTREDISALAAEPGVGDQR